MEQRKKIALGVAGGLGIIGLLLILRKPAGEIPPDGEIPPVECVVDTDCPDDFVCVDGQCIPG